MTKCLLFTEKLFVIKYSFIFDKQQEMSSNLTVLIININSTWTVLLLKLTIGCERFYLCRLFTIDLFKPKIVTGQYN
jgi:hypothetical protein